VCVRLWLRARVCVRVCVLTVSGTLRPCPRSKIADGPPGHMGSQDRIVLHAFRRMPTPSICSCTAELNGLFLNHVLAATANFQTLQVQYTAGATNRESMSPTRR